MSDDTSTPHAESHPPLSGDSAVAPWTGRRMYASGHVGPKGGSAHETEASPSLGVAESAMWGSFLKRMIKSPVR